MLPMVPNNRDNMIAWLAARCDGPNYGKVIEFAFSKEKLDLRSGADRGPDRSGYDDLPAAFALEPDGFPSHPGQSVGDSD